MKATLKLISTIVLLVLVLEPVLSPVIFQLYQRSVQHEMKERLEEEMLHSITIAKDDLRWVKPGKEILVDDHLFDIKKIIDKGDGTLFITGIFDYEETRLVEQMTKNQENENSNKQLAALFQLMQALPGDEPGEYLPLVVICTSYAARKEALYSSFKNILTPPPRS